jgi:hypothetical protein
MVKQIAKLTTSQFIATLQERVSSTVRERTLIVSPHHALNGKHTYLTVSFINLPLARAAERRGGGAENENNRVLFIVDGFSIDPSEPAEKVSLEHLVNHIHLNKAAEGKTVNVTRSLRKKIANPDKIATYLATYLNNLADSYAPNFTHE